uniref:Glutaredoxin and cysteine rich domain containing 2 n=1 Tax=Laticauda laticaudata TaxID=8630 RepID=A0A8C5SFV4_LATLA
TGNFCEKPTSMDESRKVRFKISSSYSGRVLKQMYEDGQELEIPAEDYSHNCQSWNFEPQDNLLGIKENPNHSFYPSAKLNAQRISVFREGNKYTVTSSSSLLNDDKVDGLMHPRILDFGRIIIYTSNLKIIQTPLSKKELMERIMQNEGVDDSSFMNFEEKGGSSSVQSNGNINSDETELGHNQQVWVRQLIYFSLIQDFPGYGKLFNQAFVFQEGNENSCSQCKGSGSAPCSMCHGSKFSMLANRFKESYRALRCPACNENGQQHKPAG